MSRNHEMRLQRLEGQHAGTRLSHEEWLDRLALMPSLTETESIALDADIEAEAIGEFGSLAAAAGAARIRAKRTVDPLHSLLAVDMETRARDLEAAHASDFGL